MGIPTSWGLVLKEVVIITLSGVLGAVVSLGLGELLRGPR